MADGYPAGNYYNLPRDYDAPRVSASPPAPLPASVGGAYGWARYTQSASALPLVLSAGARTQLALTPDPALTLDHLGPPFQGVPIIGSGVLLPRVLNDLLDVLVNLLVTPQVTGGMLLLELDVSSPAGPVGTDVKQLFTGPGVSGRVSLRTKVTVLENFVRNGAAVYLTSTVPVSVTSATVMLNPLSAGP